jgi:hypothetical protein
LTAELRARLRQQAFYQIMVRQLVPVIKPKLDARQLKPCTTSWHRLSGISFLALIEHF